MEGRTPGKTLGKLGIISNYRTVQRRKQRTRQLKNLRQQAAQSEGAGAADMLLQGFFSNLQAESPNLLKCDSRLSFEFDIATRTVSTRCANRPPCRTGAHPGLPKRSGSAWPEAQ